MKSLQMSEPSVEQTTEDYEAILEGLGEGILVVTRSGHVRYTNQCLRTMWNLSNLQCTSGDLGALREHISLQLVSRNDFDGTLLHCKDGRTIEWVERVYRVDGVDSGQIHCFRDISITASDAALRAALAAKEQRFMRMVSTIPGMVYQFCLRADGSSAFLFVSDGCREIYGLEPDEIMQDGSTILRIVHPDDLAGFQATIEASAVSMQLWIWTGRVVLPNGQLKWLQGASQPSRAPNGDIIWDGQLMDITQRKLDEQEAMRAKVQEKLLAVQAAALSRLSTPLVPVRDDIMVMPLIGTIDRDRADKIMQSLLEGVSRSGARYMIMDITGVTDVDAEVAESIVRAAQAVRLLGAEVMLTGIRADVAQTLIRLGVGLGSLTTHATLQSAVAHAMRKRAS